MWWSVRLQVLGDRFRQVGLRYIDSEITNVYINVSIYFVMNLTGYPPINQWLKMIITGASGNSWCHGKSKMFPVK